MSRFQTIKEVAVQTGYTEAAIRSKISRGDWPEEEVWVRAPDGRILIDMQGFEDWVVARVPNNTSAGDSSEYRASEE